MNFIEAVGYSFKSQNIPKILTIVLIAIIAGVSVFATGIAFESLIILMMIFPVLLAYSLFVSGYTISVLRAVVHGDDSMPAFAFWRDLERGALVLIASVVYALPIMLLFFCGFMLFAYTAEVSRNSYSANGDGLGFLMFCGMFLFVTFIGFIINYSIIVGRVRYAIEDSAGALFNIGKNFSIVMSNLGKTFGLFFRQMGIAFVFSMLSSMLLNGVTLFSSNVVGELVYALDRGSIDEVFSLGFPLAFFGSVYYIIALTIGLMQTFSGAHLIARYGLELGLFSDKLKNDESRSDSNIVLIIVAVIILLALVACATVLILALLGPTIGNVFSEVVPPLQ